jgi:hypothetical protein
MMRAITAVAKGRCHHPSKRVTSNTRNFITRWAETRLPPMLDVQQSCLETSQSHVKIGMTP